MIILFTLQVDKLINVYETESEVDIKRFEERYMILNPKKSQSITIKSILKINNKDIKLKKLVTILGIEIDI